MGAPAPPTKPTLHHGPPRPIPRELRAKRDDEVREESSIVWRAEDAARQALLRSQPFIRRLKHKAETAMNEVKSTYALLFGERERETGEVEAVRKSLGRGDHFHVSEVLYHALEHTLETNERLARMPPRKFHEEVAIDVADAVRKKIEKRFKGCAGARRRRAGKCSRGCVSERDVVNCERAAGAAAKTARESPALLARPPRLRLRQP